MFQTSKVLTAVALDLDVSDYFLTFTEEELKIWQQELYSMLVELADFFEESDIKYTLSGGTCLGAVRHGGFIPWDDDIDLNFPRIDFNELDEKIKHSHLNDKYTVLLPGKSTKPLTKGIIRREDIYIHELFPNKKVNKEAKMYIDIYSIENIPDNKLFRFGLGLLTTFLNLSITSNNYSKENNPLIHKLAQKSRKLRFNLFIRSILALPTMPFIKYGKVKNKPIIFLNRIYTYLAHKTTECSTIYNGGKRYFGEIMETDAFQPKIKMKFIDREFWIPYNYDKYLTQLYGDYMEIPPHNKRKIHLHTYDF